MAAGATYVPISTQTLGSAAATISFSSIPATYTDLVLIIQAQTTNTTAQNFNLTFNGSATGYSRTFFYGTGTAAGTSRTSSASTLAFGVIPTTATGWSIHRINIMNYANTTTYKTTLIRADNLNDAAFAAVGLWASTSAITSISLASAAGNINTGSIATLYGIAAA